MNQELSRIFIDPGNHLRLSSSVVAGVVFDGQEVCFAEQGYFNKVKNERHDISDANRIAELYIQKYKQILARMNAGLQVIYLQ